MKHFELESYKALAAMELEQDNELRKAEASMRKAEVYLASAKETAMDKAKAELNGLIQVSDAVWKMQKPMEKGATVASKKHVEATMSLATASMNSATASINSTWNGIFSKKVSPS
ncbi:Protein TolA like [Actinidia chinensis var. chinensis]|uniref:Protein TolA like n=1 Tax=Actinidia chinensis var. chinensis TaxID=1590841 RepID=A0A2R6RDW2_ACTCC|nr:Protein TolA like [Actinidia chinensis var. chinensis]